MDKRNHPEKRKQMVRLFARGLSYRKISKTLKVSLYNVQYWSKKISKEEIEIERAKIKVEQQQKIENYWLEEERKLLDKKITNNEIFVMC